MRATDRRELQRLRYHQGQLLRSRDFRDQAAIEAQQRWWHNRAIHSAFGVVQGLQATLEPDPSCRPSVAVAPGLAYDAFGRELVNDREQSIAVPDASAALTLLARYEPGGRRTMGLMWRASTRVELSDGVPLAQLMFDGAGVLSLHALVIPRVRSFARSRIACGATIAGQTPWARWLEPATQGWALVLGARRPAFQLEIDTRAAGFTRVPRYFAWLELPPVVPEDEPDLPLLHVYARALDSVGVRVWVPNLERRPMDRIVRRIRRGRVCWIGIEPDSTHDTEPQEVKP